MPETNWDSTIPLTTMSDLGLAYRAIILAIRCRTHPGDADAHSALTAMADVFNARFGVANASRSE